MGKIYNYIIATCANYQGNHQIISVKCSIRYKVEKEARKKKDNKKMEKINKVSEKENIADRKLIDNQDKKNLDLAIENDDWATSPVSSALSFYNKNKGPDSTDKWD